MAGNISSREAESLYRRSFPPNRQSMLIFHDAHDSRSIGEATRNFISATLPLAIRSNVRTQFHELPYYLNPVLEAHFTKLKKPDGTLAVDDDHLRKAIDAAYESWPDLDRSTYEQIKAAHDNTIATFAFDPRGEAEYLSIKKRYEQTGSPDSIYVDGPRLSESGTTLFFSAYEAESLLPKSVNYRNLILNMQRDNIPSDVIMATVSRLRMERAGGNGIMVVGAGHLNGLRIDQRMQGLVNEALAAQGVQVTSGILADTPAGLDEHYRKLTADVRSHHGTITRDLPDFVMTLSPPGLTLLKGGRYQGPLASALTNDPIYNPAKGAQTAEEEFPSDYIAPPSLPRAGAGKLDAEPTQKR